MELIIPNCLDCHDLGLLRPDPVLHPKVFVVCECPLGEEFVHAIYRRDRERISAALAKRRHPKRKAVSRKRDGRENALSTKGASPWH